MQLTQKQLDTHHKLSSLYLISGDDALLVQDAREAIIIAARKNGFVEKHICHIDHDFSIESLTSLLHNQDLFSDKKIVDIRNPTAKFDKNLSALLEEYASKPHDDQLIIISTNRLSAAQQKSSWFELIKKHGHYLFIWPVALDGLPAWISERAKQKFSLSIPIDVARLLAQFSEGNLLSAHQALEKLKLLYSDTEITREQLITVLSDHARFSIFDLSDAIKRNNTKKIKRIMTRLAQTGEEPTLVLWAICRQLREMQTVQFRTTRAASGLLGNAKNSGISEESVTVTEQLHKALQYAAQVDEIIKGARSGDVWQALLELSLL